MEQNVLLLGENGCNLILNSFSSEQNGYFLTDVNIKSDWYQAIVRTELSTDRVHDFIMALKDLLEKSQGKIEFINEYGNFSLDIVLGLRGNVSVTGVLSKNLIDGLQLKYGFETDFSSLEKFHNQLGVISEQV